MAEYRTVNRCHSQKVLKVLCMGLKFCKALVTRYVLPYLQDFCIWIIEHSFWDHHYTPRAVPRLRRHTRFVCTIILNTYVVWLTTLQSREEAFTAVTKTTSNFMNSRLSPGIASNCWLASNHALLKLFSIQLLLESLISDHYTVRRLVYWPMQPFVSMDLWKSTSNGDTKIT